MKEITIHLTSNFESVVFAGGESVQARTRATDKTRVTSDDERTLVNSDDRRVTTSAFGSKPRIVKTGRMVKTMCLLQNDWVMDDDEHSTSMKITRPT